MTMMMKILKTRKWKILRRKERRRKLGKMGNNWERKLFRFNIKLDTHSPASPK